MKLQSLFSLLILHTFFMQSDQEGLRQGHPSVHVTINAPTNSNLRQNNDTDQTAEHQSEQKTHVQTNIDAAEHNKVMYQDLKPHESCIKFMARNAIKGGIIYGIGCACPPLLAAYAVNRLLIQPLLDNGDLFETVSQEERIEYAEKGQKKIPDMIMFPILHSIKERLTKPTVSEESDTELTI